MEPNSEKSSRVPLLLVGEPLPQLGAGVPFVADISAIDNLNQNLYFLLSHRAAFLREAIDQLVSRGVRKEQILICLRAEAPPEFTFDPLIGTLELTVYDSPEELRFRLLARLETQRHRKLAAEIERARIASLASDLSPEEWSLRMETAHLTHAFCCSLQLPASRHGESLRYALTQAVEDSSAPWLSGAPLEQLLPLCARLAIRHSLTPALFREEIRRVSAGLPFRTRTELRDVAERCLESVWKGIPHVA